MATKKLIGLDGGVPATIGTSDTATIGGSLAVTGNLDVTGNIFHETKNVFSYRTISWMSTSGMSPTQAYQVVSL